MKIAVLWLLVICGFASHSVCDMLPMFWGKDMAVVATDGNVDQGMMVFMMLLSFFVPVCGIFCSWQRAKALRITNAVLAVLIALFNIAHAVMELPSDNAGQYVVMPTMILIGLVLAWQSIQHVKEGQR